MCAAPCVMRVKHANTMSATVKTASIVLYRSAATINACIDALTHALPTLNRLVIVRHDDTPLPRTIHLPHTILTQPNRGFGAGHNLALRHIAQHHNATAQHIHLILNPDAYIAPCIRDCVEHFANDGVAIVGTQLIDTNNTPDPHCAGAEHTMCHAIMTTLRTPRLPQHPATIDRVSAAAMLVRLRDILTIGGFDESYFLYYEDADLCRRLRNAGKRIIFDPTCRTTHIGGTSFATAAAQKAWYARSRKRYIRAAHGAPYTLLDTALLRTLYTLRKWLQRS